MTKPPRARASTRRAAAWSGGRLARPLAILQQLVDDGQFVQQLVAACSQVGVRYGRAGVLRFDEGHARGVLLDGLGAPQS
ncbi:hypothetical protein OG593_37245 (plasmid) [Streptomyces atratus]